MHIPRRARGRFDQTLALTSIACVTLLGVSAIPAVAGAQGIVFRLPGLGPTSYTFTNTTLATYRHSNLDQNQFDDGYLALTERFDSALTAAPWRLQLRIDGSAPVFNRAIPAEGAVWAQGTQTFAGCALPYCRDYLRPELRVERVSLRYQRNGITAEVGDVYTVVGRGLAVAFRKVDPLGLDNALRGGRFEIDVDRFTFRAFGGYVNPQNLDPITGQVNHDWGGAIAGGASTLRAGPDILGGAEAAARVGPDEDLEIGVHALRLHAADSLGLDYDVDVYGLRASAPSVADGALSFHFEADGLRRQTSYFRVGRTPEGVLERGAMNREQVTYGHALFGAVQFQRGNVNILAEWKDYTNYLLSPSGSGNDPRRIYSASPTLEREDMQLRSNSNARGGRMRVEYAFRPGPWSASLTGVANGVSELNDQDPWDGLQGGYGVAHGYLTFRRRARIAPAGGASGEGAAAPVGAAGIAGAGATRVSAGDWQLVGSVGYRHEWILSPGTPHTLPDHSLSSTDWQIYHGDIDVAFSVGPTDSLDVRLDVQANRRWTTATDPMLPDDYRWYSRSGLAVTWAHGDRWTFSAFARYDSFLSSSAKLTEVVQANGSIVSAPYPFIYPGGEIRWSFVPGSTLRLFGGMTPGGRLCTGGVCRDVSPFQGALLELVLRI